MLKTQLGHHRNKLHLKYVKIEKLNCNNISQHSCFYTFDQINGALMSIKDFQKHKLSYFKILTSVCMCVCVCVSI